MPDPLPPGYRKANGPQYLTGSTTGPRFPNVRRLRRPARLPANAGKLVPPAPPGTPRGTVTVTVTY